MFNVCFIINLLLKISNSCHCSGPIVLVLQCHGCSYIIDIYQIPVADKPVRDEKSYIPKSTLAMFKTLPTFKQASLNDAQDPYEQENKAQTKHLQASTKKVPVYILSPIVNIVWLYLCAPFRDQMDFNFELG